MPRIRLANQNCEWMNTFFGPDAKAPAWLKTGQIDQQKYNVDRAASRLGALLLSLDADVICIQEAPSRAGELELFVERYLKVSGGPAYDYLLGDTGGEQKVGLLFRAPATAALSPSADIPELLEPWLSDIHWDGLLESYRFTRRPLAVELTLGAQTVTVLSCHSKSDHINLGEALWNDPAHRQEYVITALKDRRRISTEAMRIRELLERRLDADAQARLIVAGHLNDGPGRHYFARNYLTHNVIDILVGSALAPEQTFRHAQHDVAAADRWTAEFNDFVEGVPDRKLLLDHIILSPGLQTGAGPRYVAGSGRVHQAEYDAQVSGSGAKRDQRPTDHRPVSVEIDY